MRHFEKVLCLDSEILWLLAYTYIITGNFYKGYLLKTQQNTFRSNQENDHDIMLCKCRDLRKHLIATKATNKLICSQNIDHLLRQENPCTIFFHTHILQRGTQDLRPKDSRSGGPKGFKVWGPAVDCRAHSHFIPVAHQTVL